MSPSLDDRLRSSRAERGASAVEYGLLIGAIAAVIIIVVFAFGGQIGDLFDQTCQDIHHQNFGAATCS